MSSILLSALRAHEIMMANASSNMANMNTPEYKAIRTTITSPGEGTIDVTTIRSDEPAPMDMEGIMQSNVDPARELVDMMRAKTSFEAVLDAISTREEMLDDIMDALTRK